MKAWNAANPRDRRAYKAAYDAKNREKNARKYKENRPAIRAAAKDEYRRNRSGYLERAHRRLKEKKDEVLAYQADYYRSNTMKVKARVKAYNKAHPEVRLQAENRRRVRKANAGGSHTIEERVEKFRLLGNVCFYCGSAGPITIDHDIPLARGGGDGIENILPACRPCNSSKNASTSLQFITRRTRRAQPKATP